MSVARTRRGGARSQETGNGKLINWRTLLVLLKNVNFYFKVDFKLKNNDLEIPKNMFDNHNKKCLRIQKNMPDNPTKDALQLSGIFLWIISGIPKKHA